MQCERDAEPTRIWILRHGQSNLNQAQCFQGSGAASRLTEHGMRSAQHAAVRLAGEKIEAVYFSPLERAVETSTLVRSVLFRYGVYPEFHVEPALQELDLPGWEGLSYEAVRQMCPESFREFRHAPATFVLYGQDGKKTWPVLELDLRIRALMPRILSRHAGRSILLVTHGGPARMLLLAALGLNLDHFHSIQQSHGGLSCISATNWPNQLRLDLLNETSHTGEALPKLKEGKTGVRLLMVASDSFATGVEDSADGIAHLLESLPIHCVIAAGSQGVMKAMRLLRFRSRATVETCTEADLGEAFENQLRKRRSNELINLLITGRGELLAGLLLRSMQSNIETRVGLQLRSGLSVIHLPGATQRPILQAVNTYRAG